MGYWNTRGLRGSTLEEMVNITNDAYREAHLALIQKVPTPITPVEFNKQERNITLAYFDKDSTVDYIGAAQGMPLCFDAKETSRSSLPLENIHAHQIEFMREFERQGGLAFLLVHFAALREFYFLPYGTLADFWQAAQTGGRKSIPRAAFDPELLIRGQGRFLLHYLEAINTYLSKEGTK